MSQRHLFNAYNITDEMLSTKIKDITVANSRILVNCNRVDLIAKHIYIDAKILKRNERFSKELYASHINAFTHGKFVERGQEGKKDSLDRYYEIFDNLIEQIETNGFDSSLSRVPLDKKGIIMDGAHRTAVCSYFKLPIEVSQFNTIAPVYDYVFFKKRMMKSKYLDFIIHRYVQISEKNIYTLCLWPKAYHEKDQVQLILKRNVAIVYEKEVTLTPIGAHSFISQIYHHHDWVGTPKNRFKGSMNKVEACFNYKDPLTLFVIETEKSLNEILELKEEVRSVFNYGKHSVHITDNEDETEQISELLLNANSIYHLNYANAFKFHKGVDKFLDFKKKLRDNDYNEKEVIIDGSGSMEVFGLREANDIDFISNQDIPKLEDYSKRTMNALSELYGKNIDDLQSPDSYFYFFGLKFLTLNRVLEGKRKRSEKKDNLDVEILLKFLKSNRVSGFEELKFNFKKRRIHLKRNFRILIGNILRKVGILDVLKRILKR